MNKNEKTCLPAGRFPEGFLWGVANSAYQVEGDNTNSDWYQWEIENRTEKGVKNGQATDYWNRYKEDHILAEQIGCNAFRNGLEWSKIEPEEGKFSEDSIEHYRQVLLDLKQRGMKRVITLNHWTLPLWFVSKGGWHGKNPEDYFVRFVKKVIQELGEEIDICLVLNEPIIPLNKGYLAGVFPPGKRSILAFWRARRNMINAHKKSYQEIKKYFPDLPVGITQFCNTFEADGIFIIFRPLLKKFQLFYNWGFVMNSLEYHDFIGIDYYATFKMPFFKRMTTENRLTDMGWGIYPKGLYDICMEARKKFKKPIYIFENGLADANDKYRSDFIMEHLKFLNKAIDDGADVRGYFYWSLTDNFEWNKEFDPRFGLVEIDYKTLERKPRPSFYAYKKIIENNGIEE